MACCWNDTMKTWQMSPMPSRDREPQNTGGTGSVLEYCHHEATRAWHCIVSVQLMCFYLWLPMSILPGLFSSKAVREECIFFEERRWDFWSSFVTWDHTYCCRMKKNQQQQARKSQLHSSASVHPSHIRLVSAWHQAGSNELWSEQWMWQHARELHVSLQNQMLSHWIPP